MTDEQKVLLEMLREIDALCKEYNIEYFLTGRFAKAVSMGGDQLDMMHIGTICMTPSNFIRFIRIAGNRLPKDRVIEHMKNNPNYEDLSASYINTNTVYYKKSLLHTRDHLGMQIRVEVLRAFYKKSQVPLSIMFEEAWKYHVMKQIPGGNGKEALAVNGLRWISSVFGQRLLAKIMFSLIMLLSRWNPLKKWVVFGKNGKAWPKVTVYHKKLFSEKTNGTLFSENYPVPADLISYIYKTFKQDSESINNETTFSSGIFASATISYKDLPIEEWKKDLLPKIIELKQERARTLPFRRQRMRYFRILVTSYLRYCYAIDLLPKKDLIIQTGKYKNDCLLKTILSDYRKDVERYLKYGLSLHFDEEITRVLCDWYKREGKPNVARRIIKTIPVQHQKELHQSKYFRENAYLE